MSHWPESCGRHCTSGGPILLTLMLPLIPVDLHLIPTHTNVYLKQLIPTCTQTTHINVHLGPLEPICTSNLSYQPLPQTIHTWYEMSLKKLREQPESIILKNFHGSFKSNFKISQEPVSSYKSHRENLKESQRRSK